MKWLYLIGEVHPNYSYYQLENLLKDLKNEKIKNYIKKRYYEEYRIFELRRKEIRKVLEKVKPKVVFAEGKQTNLRRKEIPYDGKIVFLDDENPGYELFFKKVKEIFKQAEKCKEKMLEYVGTYREYFWYKKILKHYKNPSLLICGIGHLVNWKNFFRFMITPNLQSQRENARYLLHRKRNRISRLIDWLELEGIKTKLVGVLNYTC